MIFLTHIIFAIFLALLYMKAAGMPLLSIGFLATVILSSLLPDIECATSVLGRRVKFMSFLFRHRGFFHSVLLTVIGAVLAYLLTGNSAYAVAFMIGFGSHILLDCLTPAGVELFWPVKMNVHGRFRTRGLVEMLLFAVFTVAALYLVKTMI